RGSIVNVSSLAGVVPARGLAIYSSAKAAMIALTRSLALELGPRIRVNAVAPGIVETEMGMSLFNAMGVDANQWIKENTVTGNPVSAEDVAEIVHVLVTVNSIVGQTIIIDSGQSLVGGF
ncbi:MAG: SDR family oxidoreductase, partial [Nitrososphaerota archaeon]|nr:SDR family oxidoreductase [Nitrososphaerota archaeon]